MNFIKVISLICTLVLLPASVHASDFNLQALLKGDKDFFKSDIDKKLVSEGSAYVLSHCPRKILTLDEMHVFDVSEMIVWSKRFRYMSPHKIKDQVIYHFPPYEAHPKFPYLDKETKAIVLAMGGSGTKKSTGSVWYKYADELSKYGIAVIGFDLPFHEFGPHDLQLMQWDKFMNYTLGWLKEIQSTGLPLYAVGHSFGPNLIQGLLWKKPDLFKGALMLSAAGMHPELNSHYLDVLKNGVILEVLEMTEEEAFSKENTFSNVSIDSMLKQNSHFFKASAYPTQIPIKFASGESDPWMQKDLLLLAQSYYKNSSIEWIPGGHASTLSHSLITKRAFDGGKTEVSYLSESILRLIEQTTLLKFPHAIENINNSLSRFHSFYVYHEGFRNYLREKKYPVERHWMSTKHAARWLNEYQTQLNQKTIELGLKMKIISRADAEGSNVEELVKKITVALQSLQSQSTRL